MNEQLDGRVVENDEEKTIKQAKKRELLGLLDLVDSEECLDHYSDLLLPKRATVVDATEEATSLGIKKGDDFVLSGKFRLPRDVYAWRRTVFLADQTLDINDIPHHIDVKGYGMNGKELFSQLHIEEDLFFGMYLDNAKREFYYPKQLQEMGINNIQKPLALLEFPEAEFIRFATVGLAQGVSANLMLRKVEEETLARICMRCEDIVTNPNMSVDLMFDSMGYVLATDFYKAYISGGIEAVKSWATQYNFDELIAGVTNGKKYGYILRAVKSPVRVGDLHDPKIVTDGNRQIARKVGTTVRDMFEVGYWDTSPNPGNWTEAGELVDFEDVAKLPEDMAEIKAEMKMLGLSNIEEFLRHSLGEYTTGLLAEDFRYGFIGKQTTEDELVIEALGILQQNKNIPEENL